MQIEQENKRTYSIPFLGDTEKEAIMKEKYLATMKPVRDYAALPIFPITRAPPPPTLFLLKGSRDY